VPDDDRWLVVGLGNPVLSTRRTGTTSVRWCSTCSLLERAAGSGHTAHGADVVEGRLGGPSGASVVLAKPRSYMNESGGPVSALTQFYKVVPDRLVIVHDELDLPYGGLRLKCGGGDNGHNGLKSIRRSLGTGDWHRVRVGIGRPPGAHGPGGLRAARLRRSGAQGTSTCTLVEAADAVETLVRDGLEEAQQRHNS
jgi:PTH1 family peptidyl-tRNA hydrolase